MLSQSNPTIPIFLMPDINAVSVADFGLGLQAWLGGRPFDPSLVELTSWPALPRCKPDHGFFTSTWKEDRRTSAWIEFKATTHRAFEAASIWLLEPNPDASLYVVDSPADWAALVEAYPHRYENPRNPTVCPNWRTLTSGSPFDAVHVTTEALIDRSQPYTRLWQVESTLWLRSRLTLLGEYSAG